MVQHTSWWHLSLRDWSAPTPYFPAPLWQLFLLLCLTRSLFFPCLPWTSFLISLTGSRNHGFSKQASDSNWGKATATAGDKMTQLASEARQELQSSFRDRTKIAKFAEMRMNINQNMHNGWADFKENRTMKSFFWEGQFSSGSSVIVAPTGSLPEFPHCALA